jgi:hypothetical protein
MWQNLQRQGRISLQEDQMPQLPGQGPVVVQFEIFLFFLVEHAESACYDSDMSSILLLVIAAGLTGVFIIAGIIGLVVWLTSRGKDDKNDD